MSKLLRCSSCLFILLFTNADSCVKSVGDKKYLREGEDHKTLAHNVLTKYGASAALAQKVQVICLGVSYSSEIQDLQYVQDLIAQHPYVF